MILQNTYYLIKPYLPWSLRIFLRRRRAHSRRKRFQELWPIDAAAGIAPPTWGGWPDGKRFAVVLTHDVEGAKGLSRTLKLMEVERKHGFRSSFNFVPKGDYQADLDLRSALDRAGFEVGVHGLEHDGKLYRSKAEFAQKATQIREYMRQWNAAGFRSPLMQHKLGWLHQLGAEYDASTFDTDPFEPQPDGVRTIFPFWVPSRAGGYLELPYTLVQDFTLFTILGQTNTDIWKKKTDWIAAQGGMVLLNTHPDYICFDGSPQRDEYSLSHYEDFLVYLKTKYNNEYWSVLPRDVARFYRSKHSEGEPRNTRRKVCLVVDKNHISDDKLLSYVSALIKSGDHVEIVAISADGGPLIKDNISGVPISPITLSRINESNIWLYALTLVKTLFKLSVRLSGQNKRSQYDLVHFYRVPTCLVFAGWSPRRTGAKLLLEFNHGRSKCERYAETRAGAIFAKILRKLEKTSVTFVDHMIISKQLLNEKVTTSSISKEKHSVLPYCGEARSMIGFLDQTINTVVDLSDRSSQGHDFHGIDGRRGVEVELLQDGDGVTKMGQACVDNARERIEEDYVDLVGAMLVEKF